MEIDFYFDPSCPWCWVTSRWLVEVSEERDLKINWKPFSLALKNDELDGNDVTGHLDTHTIAHQLLRMFESIIKKENLDRGYLYQEFGKAYFLNKKLDDDIFMKAVLEKLQLNKEYLDEIDNKEHDHVLKQYISEATEIVGEDVGVPLIIFRNENGEKQGFFGPVLQGLPEKDEALEIFDAVSKLATKSKFFEIKRARKGRSKVKTTKRLYGDIE